MDAADIRERPPVEEPIDGVADREGREDYHLSRRDYRKKILIVEDEPLNRQVITRYFGLLADHGRFYLLAGTELLKSYFSGGKTRRKRTTFIIRHSFSDGGRHFSAL